MLIGVEDWDVMHLCGGWIPSRRFNDVYIENRLVIGDVRCQNARYGFFL